MPEHSEPYFGQFSGLAQMQQVHQVENKETNKQINTHN